ncbi:MAG: hypothetical protein ABW321_07490 [Polyangiales bacterium]
MKKLWMALIALHTGCAGPVAPALEPTAQAADYAPWPDPLALMPHGPDQLARVCSRQQADRVHDMFCAGGAPTLTSLIALETALGIAPDSLQVFKRASQGEISGISISGHSTGLSTRSVSALNPRVFITRVQVLDFDFIALAFTRGEQFVELVTRDRVDQALHFYLVAFRTPCSAAAEGCKPGDLLTPAIERDWRAIDLYDEVDLANTVLDCAPCHQPNGPGTPKLLRMQELDPPWTHWFWRNSAGGRALLADYFAAKGDEPLAGLTPEQIQGAEPETLTTAVILDHATQPNEFESFSIENEVQASAAALGGQQPEDNSVPGQSATWRGIFERAQHGLAIGVPYHDVKVTDATKLARMSEVYRAVQLGELPASSLPDIRDVFPDDPQLTAELGFSTEPSLDGPTTLMSACGSCHNSRLDPGLSRARFRADLVGMSREERDLAITRISLPVTDPLAMPPARLRVLTDEARRRAIAALLE